MGDNVIYTDNDEAIGFYKDVERLLCEQVEKLTGEKNYEEASSILDNLKELTALKEYGGLIILSDNNGMGFTATPYKETI
jgi:hypothetical protein